MELGLGQAGEGFHLPLISEVHAHQVASSMAFWSTAYLILYWGTTLFYLVLGGRWALGAKTPRERRAAHYYACDDEERLATHRQIGVQKYKEDGRLSRPNES